MSKLKSLGYNRWNKAQWNNWDNDLTTEQREDQEQRYEEKINNESDYGKWKDKWEKS